MHLRKMILFIILFLLPVSYAQTNDYLSLANYKFGGIERTYYQHLPPNFDELNLLPLVMVLHGGGKGDGDDISKHLGMNIIADKENFIVVYPNGIEAQWNDGRGKIFKRNKSNEDVDDVGFISELIDHFIENYNVDKKRIYITGASNGGMMALRLGCEIKDKMAAIAPIIANILKNIVGNCKPKSFLPVLMINGTEDPLVPWKGGHVKFLWRKMGKVLSTESSIKFWVKHNKCFDDPVIYDLPDIDDEDESRVRVTTYKNSKDGVEVVLYAVVNGGHNIPGSNTPEVQFLLGNKNNDFNSAEVIWNFFKKYKRE